MMGYLVYKCRSCGEEHKPTSVPDIQVAMASILTGTPLPRKWGAIRYLDVMELHVCSNGRIGLSDLVGAEPRDQR